ncbi:MAG: Fe-S-containing protein, partial [Candidatus Bipolaricaulota bacterium]|nr:Fe-S-containing protein [Candidatus Bipolaricaulota bacterium]
MMVTNSIGWKREPFRRRNADGTCKVARRATGAVAAVLLGVWLCAGLAATAVAAESVITPARPLAQAMATKNHDPFPLVTADSTGEVRFALTEFSDGLTHFYTFMAKGLPVEFFVIWTPDNVIRTALDACDVC